MYRQQALNNTLTKCTNNYMLGTYCISWVDPDPSAVSLQLWLKQILYTETIKTISILLDCERILVENGIQD